MTRYIPLILIEGATVMAVELCGAKLLAPLYGGSLFVWAAILAVTLGALAFGYYYGGVLSSKNEIPKKLFNVIAIAAACIVLMPFLSTYILPYISYINFKVAVMLSASLVIFLPIFFLGCTTPLLIRLNTISAETSGLISGKIYAISTVGGIVSTLLCGFLLIPHVGLNATLISFAVLLFSSSVFILKLFKTNTSIPFLVLTLFGIRTMFGSSDPNVLYAQHGIMGEIMVKEYITKTNPVRCLLINQTVQTEMSLLNGRSVSNYIKCIDSIIVKREKKRGGALILGLGGGLLANVLSEKDYAVDAVEFDPRVIEIAKKYFKMHEDVNCFAMDARTFVNQNIQKDMYDLVIMDLFKAEEQPSHTITYESFTKMNQSTLIINWHGYMDGELGKGTQILLNTLHKAGFETTMIPGPGGEDHRNTLIVCDPSGKTNYDPSVRVNTDDQPVIELANAKANMRWRQNYLRFYQGSK